jgi:small subunit ribosomal protein S16
LAVRIRLTRTGRKKLPSYRVVVADSRMPRDGRFIEAIGFYDPKTDPSTIDIDADKAKAWLAKGAKPSNTVSKLLAIAGVIDAPVKKARVIRAAAKPAKATVSKDAAVEKAAPAEEIAEAEATEAV